MRTKRLISLVPVLTILLAAFTFSACGKPGDPVKVTIFDCGKSETAEGTDDMTVAQLLGAAGINISDRDTVEPKRDARWVDAGAHAITVKRYAKVKVSNGSDTKDVELIGGTVDLAISQAGFMSSMYDSDVDKREYLTDGMEIHLTMRKDGFVSDGKTAYYISGGEVQKGGIVGSENDGYYYADDSGVIDTGYCDGVNVGGVDWYVIEGRAGKAESDSDKTLHAACKAVAACTDSKMTREEKLRKCFDYIKTSYLEGVRHDPPYTEMDWPIVYANDLYVYGKGDCYSYGAAYAYMGKAIGYTEVYACNSGGHGWAEIEGKYYDPEWDIHHNEYNHFGVLPDDPCDVNYSGTLVMGNAWMRIKI
ncbi:MAG: ubiquitin-like domain-containing protein [Ruminococcus sp.]|nr:ubiquitin-like domain-containing protein [Ruminococcus sp.]